MRGSVRVDPELSANAVGASILDTENPGTHRQMQNPVNASEIAMLWTNGNHIPLLACRNLACTGSTYLLPRTRRCTYTE